jgi:hypothetical protein
MNRLLALLVCCSAVLLMGADEPKEFSPKDSGLKVKMPGEPKLVEQEDQGVKVKTWFVERNDGKEGFGVSISDIPGAATDEDADLQKRLDGARDGLLRAVNGKLIQETKLTFDKKYPGREVIGSLKDDGRIRSRYYLIKGRMYQVLVAGSKEFIESDEVKKYLQSFELTK